MTGLLILLLLALFLIGKMFLGDQKTKKEKGKIASVSSSFSVHLKEVKQASQVGSGKWKTPANGKFVVLQLEVKNTSKQVKTLNTFNFKLLDKKTGKIYGIAERATIRGQMDKKGQLQNTFFLNKVQAGQKKSGHIVFDLPKKVTNNHPLKLVIQDQGKQASIPFTTS
ncbi:DUF4352 domain-containing protein [Listeria valentina]|uniref:DUF4352 domain-containing protein n=1 Tax=Listeria valentina TaxID=2705293 RepID=UPI00142FB368|nr:DUF4352 domain-containing protein [Listeria valentina]